MPLMQVKMVQQNGHFSLDTESDVFVLCLRRYPEFPRETIFVTGTGNRRRKTQLRLIYLALGDLNTQSLPGLHSFSGAYITGTVARKGNLFFGKHLRIMI